MPRTKTILCSLNRKCRHLSLSGCRKLCNPHSEVLLRKDHWRLRQLFSNQVFRIKVSFLVVNDNYLTNCSCNMAPYLLSAVLVSTLRESHFHQYSVMWRALCSLEILTMMVSCEERRHSYISQ